MCQDRYSRLLNYYEVLSELSVLVEVADSPTHTLYKAHIVGVSFSLSLLFGRGWNCDVDDIHVVEGLADVAGEVQVPVSGLQQQLTQALLVNWAGNTPLIYQCCIHIIDVELRSTKGVPGLEGC